MTLDKIDTCNIEWENKDVQEIIASAFSCITGKPVLSTHFGPYEACIIHAVVSVKPDIDVIWVDHGYNTKETYQLAQRLIEQFALNIHIYTPRITSAFREAARGGIPLLDDEKQHAVFTEEVKLAPFAEALRELQPDIWITGIRKEQTAFRAELNILVQDTENRVKLNPFFFYTQADMQEYLQKYRLPNVENYFDPTKVFNKRECGLHIQSI